MAFSIPKVSYQSMMKDGSKHYQGIEEAVMRNIEACKQMAVITKSSYGPNGMKKIIVNHIDKIFVTKDAATIIKELDVEHPAAKIIILASKMAESEVGDGTNFVILFSSALLNASADLLKLGISPCEIIDSYRVVHKMAMDILDKITCGEINDIQDFELVSNPVRNVICTKQMLGSDHISKIVTKACILAKPLNSTSFNVDNVRCVKILGAGIGSSDVFQGLVIRSDLEGTVKKVKDAKIAIFNTDFDLLNPETHGTILLNTASELLSFSKGEEDLMKNFIQELKSTGCNVVVTSGKVSDQALDYSNREGIMVLRLGSKFDINRLSRATSSVSLSTMVKPSKEQLGRCSCVYQHEIGDVNVVIFEQLREESTVASIVIRGSSENVLDDIERAINDGVNCYKSLVKQPRLLPGAGATEMEMCHQLSQITSLSGIEQYCLAKYCDALKYLVRAISENNGLNSNKTLSKLIGEHTSGLKNHGINIDDPDNMTFDVVENKIFDLLHVKSKCLQLAVDSACTILSVDQIIMARPAGGPAPPKMNSSLDGP